MNDSRQGAKKRKENKSLRSGSKNVATPAGWQVGRQHYFRTIPPSGGKFRVSLYIFCSSSTNSLLTLGLKASPVPQYFLSSLLNTSSLNSLLFTNTTQSFLTTVVRFKMISKSSCVFFPFLLYETTDSDL